MVLAQIDAVSALRKTTGYCVPSDFNSGRHYLATPLGSSVGVNVILPVAGASLTVLNTLCQDHNNVQKTVRIAAML
jgi:hypothetical protein